MNYITVKEKIKIRKVEIFDFTHAEFTRKLRACELKLKGKRFDIIRPTKCL